MEKNGEEYFIHTKQNDKYPEVRQNMVPTRNLRSFKRAKRMVRDKVEEVVNL